MAESPKKDPSAIILPFGKHKGKTVAELLAVDPRYADWVSAQAWVAERFAELHSAIVSRGAGVDDSPEHNAIQGRFLDKAFRDGFVLAAYDRDMAIARAKREIVAEARSDLKKTWRPDIVEAAQWCLDDIDNSDLGLTSRAEYEVRGVDVVVSYEWDFGEWYWSSGMWKVEIKPTLSDDFPSIMRQMRRLGARCLVVGTYTGRGVSEPQMREMFRMSGITVVFVQEIEEEMRKSATPEWW